MQRFAVGDRVRIDIPDETDPDYELYHGLHGKIVETLSDDVAEITGESRDGLLYRVKLESDETIDVRWRDLRPPTN
jgi:ribosomal protein L21E